MPITYNIPRHIVFTAKSCSDSQTRSTMANKQKTSRQLLLWKNHWQFENRLYHLPFLLERETFFEGHGVGAQFRDPFVDRHHNMLVMERINSMNTSKATCGSTIETPTTYEKMDAQRCISLTTPPNYIEKYQMFSTKSSRDSGISLHKKTSKP